MKKSMGALAGAILLTLALLIAGCGGSSEEPLTKAEFVKKGNKICQEATQTREKEVDELTERFNPNGDQEAFREEAVISLLPTYQGAAEQIGDLAAPDGDEERVEEIVSAMNEAAEKVEANPQTATISNLPFRQANQAAEDYGLNACAI